MPDIFTPKDNLGDLLNASANRVKKTRVDVKSKNAAKFREMFDKGEVPEGAAGVPGDRGALGVIAEKEQGGRRQTVARSLMTSDSIAIGHACTCKVQGCKVIPDVRSNFW